MIRAILGSVVAAVAMFIIGFVFYGALGSIPTSDVGDAEAATIQQTLAANFGNDGARAYVVPSGSGSAQQEMYINGPVAMIHYNPDGFALNDSSAMLGGFLHMLISALILGAALFTLSGHVRDFGARLSIVALFGISASCFMHLGNPIWWHQSWGYHLYVFFADAVMFIVAGGIIARWFLPRDMPQADAVRAETS